MEGCTYVILQLEETTKAKEQAETQLAEISAKIQHDSSARSQQVCFASIIFIVNYFILSFGLVNEFNTFFALIFINIIFGCTLLSAHYNLE